MIVNMHTLRVTILADDKITNVLKTATSSVDKFVSSIDRARLSLYSLNQALNVSIRYLSMLAGALIGAASAVTYLGSKFEEAFQTARTMMRMSDEFAKRMTQDIFELSAQVNKSGVELAKSLYMMGSASITAEHGMDVLKKTLIAATAGATDMTTAFMGAITILNAYGYDLDKLTEVYTLQFETVKKGLITYQEMSEHFGKVAPAARQLGVSLRDSLSAYATLTRLGLDSAMASTSTARAFWDLIEKADKLKRIGIDLYDSYGRFRGLFPVIKDLKDAMSGMTEEQKAMYMQNIGFEIRAQRAINNWINSYDVLLDTQKQITGDVNILKEAFIEQTKSISFLIGKVMTNLQALGMAFYQAIRSGVVEILNKVINGLEILTDLVKENEELFGKSFWSLLRLTIALLGVVIAIKQLSRFSQVLMFLMKPLNAIIIGVITAIYLVWNALQKPGEGGILNFLKVVVDKFKALIDFFKGLIEDIRVLAQEYITEGMNPIWAWIKAIVITIAKALAKLFDMLFGAIFGEERWQKIKDAFKQTIDALSKKEGVPIFLDFIVTAKEKNEGGGEGDTKKKSLVSRLLDWAASGVKEISFSIVAVMKEIPNWVQDILAGVKDTWDLKLKPALEGAWVKVQDTALNFKEGTISVAQWIIDGAKDIALNFKEGTIDVANWIANGVKNIGLTFTEETQKALDWLINGTQTIKIKLEKAWDKAFDWLANGVQQVEVMLKLALPGKKGTTEGGTSVNPTPTYSPNDLVFDNFDGEITIENPQVNLTGTAAGSEFPLIQPSGFEMLNNSLNNFFESYKQKVSPLGALKDNYPNNINVFITGPMAIPNLSGILSGSLSPFAFVFGFAEGGYTGVGSIDEVAGVVHKGEYVIPAWLVRKYPQLIAMLETRRLRGYQEGGGEWLQTALSGLANYFFGPAKDEKTEERLQTIAGDATQIIDFLDKIHDALKNLSPDLATNFKEFFDSLGISVGSGKEQKIEGTPYQRGFEIFTNLLNNLRNLQDIGKGEKKTLTEKYIEDYSTKFGIFITNLQTGFSNFTMGLKQGFSAFKELVEEINFKDVGVGILKSIPDLALKGVFAIEDALGSVFEGLIPMVASLGSVQKLMNPIQTILETIIQILGPLIDNALKPFISIFEAIGRVLSALMLPVLQMIQPILMVIAQTLAWVYNTIIVPIARGIFIVFGLVREGFARLYNWFAESLLGKILGLTRMATKTIEEVFKEAEDLITPVDLGDIENNTSTTYTSQVNQNTIENLNITVAIENSILFNSEDKLKETIVDAVLEAIDTGVIPL